MSNLIILLTKFYIYRTQLNTEQVHLKALQNHLKENLVIQKNIYYKNKLYEKENTCWSPGVRSLFRRPIIPTANFTDNPLFRQKWSKVV